MARDTSGLRRGGGRPPGVPNKSTRDIKAFLNPLLTGLYNDRAFKRNLRATLLRCDAEALGYLKLCLAYAVGTPARDLNLKHSGYVTLEQIVAGTVPRETLEDLADLEAQHALASPDDDDDGEDL